MIEAVMMLGKDMKRELDFIKKKIEGIEIMVNWIMKRLDSQEEES